MLPVDELPMPFPIVVLKEIFRHTSTSNILNSCRFVSKAWNQVANSICRNRHVKVKALGDPGNSVSDYCIHDVFKGETDLPWSAVKLRFKGPSYNEKFCGQISEIYGNHIQSLFAKVQASEYDNFFRALRRMPNLKKLEIRLLGQSSGEALPKFPVSSIQLPKLECLNITHSKNSQFVDLLEFILNNTGAPINVLALNIADAFNDPEVEPKRIAETIYVATTRIRNVSLEIPYEHSQDAGWKFLVDQGNFKIHDLRLCLATLSIHDTGDKFKVLEHFLEKCIGLNSLHLVDFDVSTRDLSPNSYLQIPALVHLKILKLVFDTTFYDEERQQNSDVEFSGVQFNLLKSTDFPNLETIHLTTYGQTIVLEVDIREIFDPAKPFDSVNTLYLGNHHGGEGKFSIIFPNVTKIKVILQESSQLGPILDGMEHLTELDLTLFSASDNNNELLNSSYAFIQPLKKLEKLTLECHVDYEGTPLDASGLIVLRQLPPLNLIIYDSEIWETYRCINLLRGSHPRFQLLQK